MSRKNATLLLFLLGTFSMTQVRVVGSIGISELVIVFLAPWIYFKDMALLKRDGFFVAANLLLLACLGCIVSCICNHTPFAMALRGFAAPYVLFCAVVVGHRLIRHAPDGIKWFVLGMALSVTINIFVFQRSVEATIYAEGKSGIDAAAGVMSSPLFWTARVGAWMSVLIGGWYLAVPSFVQVLALMFLFFFAALTTASGRSTAACAFGSIALIILGGKTRWKMRLLSKHMLILAVSAFVAAQVLTSLYKYAALQGLMGEKSLVKYESQMRGRKGGILNTLMGGRIEFFVGAFSCLKKPIIGYGPWAIDEDNLYEDFLLKYGTDEEVADAIKAKQYFAQMGITPVRYIPGHSHLINFWLACGILGLFFWLYVLKLIWQYFRRYLAVVPQWYGFLAVGAPNMLWVIFFSPLGDRIPEAMFIVCLLAARAVARGRMHLPIEMYREMEAKERGRKRHGAIAHNRYR